MSSETNSNPTENFQDKISAVYTFAPFGNEGNIVAVEVDKRRGIPAVDIVGLADASVKEARERMRSAIKNSGFEFPAERVLISLSPADLKKQGDFYDLPLALAVLGEGKGEEPVFAMGELDPDGGVRPVRALQPALQSARAAGIKSFVIPDGNRKELEGYDFAPDEKVKFVSTLREAVEKDYERISSADRKRREDTDVVFSTIPKHELALDGKQRNLRALEIAAAGKHNILAVGRPGSGRSLLMTNVLPLITPDLTESEAASSNRIRSIAGLGISSIPDKDGRYEPPFRMPHQTSSLEGIYGGGPNIRPGEISLAHKGVLVLDEAAEFRTSVLQAMRVPIENGKITLARAGRSTIYPADFQLAMATNPCACGNAGSEGHICLCSSRSIDMYWKKISDPLLNRIEIKTLVDEKPGPGDTRKYTVEDMRGRVAAAIRIQRERGVYNSKLSPAQAQEYCVDTLAEADKKKFDAFCNANDISPRARHNILKVSLTIANMDGRTRVQTNDLAEACELVTAQVNPLEMDKKIIPFVNEKETQLSNAAEQSASAEINKKPSKEENTMAKEAQTNLNVSEKKDFSGNWIPYHNAKMIKEAIENGTAPFLPDKNGNINAMPLYNANTGYCLNAKDLIPLQIAQKEGYSGIVATKNSIEAARSSIKAKETGFFYNFKREDGSIGTTQFFFPEQTEHPEQVIEAATKKIAAAQNKTNGKENATQAPAKNTITITSADPKEYLANYVAACKTKSPLKCDPAIAEEFKKNLDVVIQNQFAKMKSFDPEIGKLNNLLFEADKKSLDIVKQINKENRPKQQTQQKQKKQEQEITF